jgi:hypothetical protein
MVASGAMPVSGGDAEKIGFLRRTPLRFYAPAIVVGLWALFILAIVIFK